MKEANPIEQLLTRFAFEANALRRAAAPGIDATKDCLDAETISALAEGSIGADQRAAALPHLARCGRCCREVASVTQLLEVPEVKREIDRLDGFRQSTHRRRFIGAMVAAALAAGVLFVIVPASTSRVAHPRYREESVTGAAAPRLVSPLGVISELDAFRWTSVPRADRYRITVFARDGSVIAETQTRDTVITLTDFVRRAPDDTMLWRVDAHVGWEDRWVSSDLAMLTVRSSSR